MLGRVLNRTLQMPLRPAASATVRIPFQWQRSASNNRRGSPKRPFDFARQQNSSDPAPPSSVDPRAASRNPVYRNPRSETTSTESQPQGTPQPWTTSRNGDPSRPEDESRTTSSPQDPAPEIEHTMHQPLPDLTKGIPSTWAFEAMERASSTKSEGQALNLTEDPNQDSRAGKQGRGELPASAYVSSSEKKRLRVANYMYAGFATLSLIGYVWLGRNWDTDEEELQHPNAPSGWAFGLMWSRVKARTGGQLDYYKKPAFDKLLPDPDPSFERPYTLVLSLEDLLIHSEWSRDHGWRMAKRPGVDYFLRYLSQYYELVIFTSQPWAIAEPVIRKLDPYHIVTWPLYREATFYKNGEYVKDLSYLNRDLSKVILVDTVPGHAKEQPDNAIIIPKWKGDPQDNGLVALIPFLEYIPTIATPDVRKAIKSFEGTYLPIEFSKREAIARKKFEDQMTVERQKRSKSGLGFVSNALGVKPMMQMEGEVSPAEAFAQGKMLQDQARERGQRNYEALEKMIRDEGEKWLKEEAANEEFMKQEGMKAMKSGLTGFFGVPGSGPKPDGAS